MKVLAADIGGTKTLLQIADVEGLEWQVVTEHRYDSQAYEQFETMLQDFIDGKMGDTNDSIAGACFGVAGPVTGSIAKITNLPWVIDAEKISSITGIEKISLINDFQSIGYGIEGLKSQDLVAIQSGELLDEGVRAVIGAGTGLGEGFLVWDGDHFEAYASEGGHVGFAPGNDLQIELLRYCQEKFGYMSYELLVSGPGLQNIFNFHVEHFQKLPSAALTEAIQSEDKSAAIARFALNNQDEMAVKALDMFVEIYGAQAGNLALTTLSLGGLYIAGGIAPKIIDKLKTNIFLDAFKAKGKMRDLMPRFPVYVVNNPKVGLIGSALVASRL